MDPRYPFFPPRILSSNWGYLEKFQGLSCSGIPLGKDTGGSWKGAEDYLNTEYCCDFI